MFDSVTPWTLARQAPLSFDFPRHEYWSGVVISSSRGSTQPRDPPRISCTAGKFSTAEHLGSWTWQGPVFGSTGRAADSAWEPVFCRSRTWRSSCSWWRSGLCVSLSFTHHFLSFNVSFYLGKKRELNWIIYSSSCLKALFYMCCKPALSNGAQSFGPMHLVQSNRPLERKWDQPFNYGTGVCLVNSSGPSAPGV